MDNDHAEDGPLSIVDALRARIVGPGPFKITAEQRQYFSYQWHDPSAAAERAAPRITPRDFRSLRERRSDQSDSNQD